MPVIRQLACLRYGPYLMVNYGHSRRLIATGWAQTPYACKKGMDVIRSDVVSAIADSGAVSHPSTRLHDLHDCLSAGRL